MMKRWFAIGSLLFLTAALFAADGKPKHNTLTPKEAAEGWILLFDGDTTFGWRSPNESKWTIAEGMLAPQAGKPELLVSTTAFADYELKFDYMRRFLPQDGDPKRGTTVQLRINCNSAGNPRDPAGRHELSPNGERWTTTTVQVKNGMIQSVNSSGSGFSRSTATATEVRDVVKPTKQSGYIAFYGNNVIFRNIMLKPLDTKPLFNGKDLTGWKKFTGDEKRAKTEFSVTKEGWLHLKNGPGDLQTVDQFQNFILQAECLSNGKHLNSGIFFRCIPDQYQNGYEAQIHNGWTEKPEKEYTIDHFDPKTNMLKNKEKIKSTALDYGTGAIYRRIPARRQVAQDNEWFTMTIAAEGRHLATWVDGIQVVDWTDDRPLNDNARNGCKVEKGAISLQGHDPTTDLSFRNIRIEVFP